MATKKNTAVVDIKQMELETVKFTIVGTTPLITHTWSEKAKRIMTDKQTGKGGKQKHEIKIPVNDFIDSLHWISEKPQLGNSDEESWAIFEEAVNNGAKFGFPVNGIKQSIISGASRSGMDVKMTELRGAFFLAGATEDSTTELAEIVGPTPVMREDMVVVGGMSKSADIRYRSEFKTWEIPLLMTYNKNGKYSLEQLLACVNPGGFATGLGEWRPERDGQYGMYRLVA